jgi:uroporphyrinogen-III synthase
MPFDGLRVLSLESRRAREMETLILRSGGKPFLAPSVKEQPIEDPSAALSFIDSLEADAFDLVICMTGVGLSFLCKTLDPHVTPERIGAALRRAVVVSRGPKPVGVLRSLGVPVEIMIPEPNTWKEIVEAVAQRPERRIAVQEYGRPGLELIAALEHLGARVTPVTLYRWELPEDLEPLRSAVRMLAARETDVVLFTSSIQLDHLLDIARTLDLEDEVKRTLREHVVVASVGPVMTATLEGHGISPQIVPKHPKMASLVKAASEESHAALTRIRTCV